MTKIILRKTTKFNAIFLAAILVVGTITLSNSSFMVGAQAQQFNGMDQMYNNYEPEYGTDNSYDNKQSYEKENNYYKSKDSSSNVKCNNINVNNNGFNEVELNALQPFLNGLETDEAQASDEGEIGASSIGSDGGRPSGSDTESRVVCINNNDNTVTTGTNEDNGGETDQCAVVKACFEDFLGPEDFETLTMALENGLNLTIGEQPETLNSFADICEVLDGLTMFELRGAIGDILGALDIILEDINGLFDCIAEALDIPV